MTRAQQGRMISRRRGAALVTDHPGGGGFGCSAGRRAGGLAAERLRRSWTGQPGGARLHPDQRARRWLRRRRGLGQRFRRRIPELLLGILELRSAGRAAVLLGQRPVVGIGLAELTSPGAGGPRGRGARRGAPRRAKRRGPVIRTALWRVYRRREDSVTGSAGAGLLRRRSLGRDPGAAGAGRDGGAHEPPDTRIGASEGRT